MKPTAEQQSTHTHFFDATHIRNERRTLYAIILSAMAMVLEVSTGIMTGSMALLAAGWHMGTHVVALSITLFAYVMARRFANTKSFTFGTGKFGILSGYTSAIFLGSSALFMIVESAMRFNDPVPIAFNDAIAVAFIGLSVSLLSVWILSDTGMPHQHGHEYDDCSKNSHEDCPEQTQGDEHKHGRDYNLRAAYLHVIADALTSILAIIALLAGKFFGWSFLDPLMGIFGGILIIKWAFRLLSNTGFLLLDGVKDSSMYDKARTAIESDGESVLHDIHIWPLNEKVFAGVLTIIASKKYTSNEYRTRLEAMPKLKHITIEVLYDEPKQSEKK